MWCSKAMAPKKRSNFFISTFAALFLMIKNGAFFGASAAALPCGGYSLLSSNCGLKSLLSLRSSLLFWGLLPAAGATLRSSLFARPCAGFARWVWPDGHCCTSLGRSSFGFQASRSASAQKLYGLKKHSFTFHFCLYLHLNN